jgi:hypothetical protein
MKLPWIVLFFLISGGLMAQNFPTPADPPKLVNDFASLLTPQEQQALESKLVAFDDSTSTQIAIVIVNTLNGYDAADYSFELAESWGIGQAGEYNGILILIAPAQQLEEKTPVFPFLLILLIFIGAMFFLVRFGNRSRGYRGRGGHTYMGPIRGGTTWTDFSRGSGTFGGGGGFGGFGGGSFGGGGAGGSW